MPVIVPNGLPAIDILADENIEVMTQTRAITQDIRPLQILILNLMPTKIATENQIIRLLSSTPLQIEMTLLQTKSYQGKNTAPEHLASFYKGFDEIKNQCFDGLIVTGAPVEKLAFDNVDYWDELTQILNWAKQHVFSTLHICWGAQAGLYLHYGIKKHQLAQKVSGVYEHRVHHKTHPFLVGFDDQFWVPHSRYTDIDTDQVAAENRLEILASSAEVGVYMVASKDLRKVFLTGHPEYDTQTLAAEYERDVKKGIGPNEPANYFVEGEPVNRWRSHGQLFFRNWLNCVYQEVPYKLEEIKDLEVL